MYDTINKMSDIKLPNLSEVEIEKLDELFNFLKSEFMIKNHSGFLKIGVYCKDKWGDDKILYYCFAETLAKNGLTETQFNNGEEYIWNQRFNIGAESFDSFKNEYHRQEKLKKQDKCDKILDRIIKKFEVVIKPLYIILLITSIGLNFFQFRNLNKNEMSRKKLQKTIDSLVNKISSNQITNKSGNDLNTIRKKK